jgi:hypothetical protein
LCVIFCSISKFLTNNKTIRKTPAITITAWTQQSITWSLTQFYSKFRIFPITNTIQKTLSIIVLTCNISLITWQSLIFRCLDCILSNSMPIFLTTTNIKLNPRIALSCW